MNKLYAGYPRRHKSNDYKKWIITAQSELLKQKKYFIEGDKWLEVNYKYYMPIWYKNGNKKKIDCFNFEKATSDFLSDNIKGFKDEHIKKGTVEKIDSDKNIVEIEIIEINN